MIKEQLRFFAEGHFESKRVQKILVNFNPSSGLFNQKEKNARESRFLIPKYYSFSRFSFVPNDPLCLLGDYLPSKKCSSRDSICQGTKPRISILNQISNPICKLKKATRNNYRRIIFQFVIYYMCHSSGIRDLCSMKCKIARNAKMNLTLNFETFCQNMSLSAYLYNFGRVTGFIPAYQIQ